MNKPYADGCCYWDAKIPKGLAAKVKPYGFNYDDLRLFARAANALAFSDAKIEVEKRNRQTHAWLYRMGCEYDYSVYCEGHLWLQLDSEEAEKLSAE